MLQNIVIYQDEGVGEFGITCLQKFFAEDDIRLCTSSDVIAGSAFENADIFIIPGGADLPYCRKLNGAGNQNIRNYVEKGGTYLGICAGAYYACRDIEFHKGARDEICAERELALMPATAIGSIPELASPYDMTLKSAAIIPLKRPGLHAYYHGGPYFRLHAPAEILADYDLPYEAPAIVKTTYGKGTVILSGVHFETTPAMLETHPQEKEEGKKLAANFQSLPAWRQILFGPQSS